ncbi:unnamed protein product [Trichobilharzia szidati]|nr:unnamed protein product [Trichobilharzia szidati]
MDNFLSSLTNFVSDACRNAGSIDIESLIDEFEAKSTNLARPLFSCENEKCNITDLATGTSNSLCTSPEIIETPDIAIKLSKNPKKIKFVYPSEDEIKTEQPGAPNMSVPKSSNQARDARSPDFDDSFTSLDLTQIMNVSEMNIYKSSTSLLIADQTISDLSQPLMVTENTSLLSDLTNIPNEFKTPISFKVPGESSAQSPIKKDLKECESLLSNLDGSSYLSKLVVDSVSKNVSTNLEDNPTDVFTKKQMIGIETSEQSTSTIQGVEYGTTFDNFDRTPNTNPYFTGFKTGKGDSVSLSSASSRKTAQSLVDALDVVDDGVVVGGGKNSDVRDSCFTGFKTGKGDSVSLSSASSRKIAQSLVDALDVVDDGVVVGGGKNSDVRDSCFTGFKTGKGDSVSLSSASSRKIAQSLVDALDVVDDGVVVGGGKNSDVRDSCFTGFKTGKGDSVSLSSASSRKTAQSLVDALDVVDDGVVVGGGKNSDVRDSCFTGFKTGKGDSVSLSSASSRKIAQSLVDALDVVDDGVVVGGGKNSDVRDSCFTGFKTGKGDSVSLSSASSRKIAQSLVDALDVVDDGVVVGGGKNSDVRDSCFTGFKTGKGDSVSLSSASSRKTAQSLVDALDVVDDGVVVGGGKNSDVRDSCFTGFKTGKGDSVSLSSASSRKIAQSLVDALDVVDDGVVVGGGKNSDVRDSCFTGFKTGKGDSVSSSNASSENLAQLHMDPFVISDDKKNTGSCSKSNIVHQCNTENTVSTGVNKDEHVVAEGTASSALSTHEIDLLDGCYFDTQFDISCELSKDGSQIIEIDMELEVDRQNARTDQQNLIAHKQSIIPSNENACVSVPALPKLRPCGLLWGIRRKNNDNNNNSALSTSNQQSFLKWNSLLANQKPCTSGIHLPKYMRCSDDVIKWSLQTADKLYWLWDMKYAVDAGSKDAIPVDYKHNNFTLIPDKLGRVGKQEILNAFLSCPEISSNLISYGWIENHYLQIMWKIGTVALLYNDLCTTVLSDYCTPSRVLNELRYRYDREIEGCQRSALRKVIEQDDTAARRLILAVSYLDISENCVKACLTDGWYQISWNPDPMLTALIKSGKIRVGSKLVTANAELIITNPSGGNNSRTKRKYSSADASSHDEFRHLYGDHGSAVGMSLKLHGNSTRPVTWYSRLGFSVKQPSSGCGMYPVALCTLSSDGGLCSSIRVVIQRRYSLQYMETIEISDQNTDMSTTLSRTNSGTDESLGKFRRRRIFRSERAEEAEVRSHEILRRQVIDSALDKLVFSDPGKRRIQPTREQLTALGNDGEALLHMILNAPDSAEAESNLTALQRDAIQRYKESVIHDAVVESVPSRQVTPLLRLRVLGLHPKDIASNYGASITLWSPTDEMLSILKEGEVVEFYRLQVSTTRVNDPFASAPPNSGFVKPIGVNIPHGFVLSLSGGRTTRIFSLGHISKLKEIIPNDTTTACVYKPRIASSVSDVHRIAVEQDETLLNSYNKGNIEVDMRCLIIAVYHTSNKPSPFRKDQSSTIKQGDTTAVKFPSSDVDCVYTTDVICGSEMCLSVIKFWDGLQTLHLTDIVQVGRVLSFTDLQIRRCQTINTVSRMNQPTRTIPLVTLNYTSASNVTSEKAGIRRTGRMTSTNETDPATVSYLQQVVKDYLCSKSGYNPNLQISDSPLNQTKSVPLFSTSNTPNSTGIGLSALLRGSSSGRMHSTPLSSNTPKRPIIPLEDDYLLPSKSVCESPNKSVLRQGLPLKEQNFTPIKRFTPTNEFQPQKQQSCETPIQNTSTTKSPYVRTLPNRSASRTGLSRKTRSRSSLVTPSNSLSSISATTVPDKKTVNDDDKQCESVQVTKSPPPSIPSMPIAVDDLCFTPEPKAKRCRSSQPSDNNNNNKDENPDGKENLVSIPSPKDILSPSDSEDKDISPSNSFKLQSSFNLNDSQMFSSSQFENDSFDSSDLSIADLVKTRQRRQARTTPQAMSTPPTPKTSFNSLQPSNRRLSLKRVSK